MLAESALQVAPVHYQEVPTMHLTLGRRSRLTLYACALAALVAVLAYLSVVHSTAQAAVNPAPPGFSLTWSDDFNGAGNTGINQNLWSYDTGPGSSFGT